MGSVTDSAAEHRGRCGHEFGVVACSPAVREYRRVFEPGADPMTEGDRASVRSTAVFVEPARVLPDNQQDPYRRPRRLRGPCSSAVLPLCSHRLGQRQLGERGQPLMRAVASVEVDVVALDGPACVSGVMASEAMVSVMAILIFGRSVMCAYAVAFGRCVVDPGGPSYARSAR